MSNSTGGSRTWHKITDREHISKKTAGEALGKLGENLASQNNALAKSENNQNNSQDKLKLLSTLVSARDTLEHSRLGCTNDSALHQKIQNFVYDIKTAITTLGFQDPDHKNNTATEQTSFTAKRPTSKSIATNTDVLPKTNNADSKKIRTATTSKSTQSNMNNDKDSSINNHKSDFFKTHATTGQKNTTEIINTTDKTKTKEQNKPRPYSESYLNKSTRGYIGSQGAGKLSNPPSIHNQKTPDIKSNNS